MRQPNSNWAAAFAIALLLTACSSREPAGQAGSAAPENAAAPDACAVVTAADIEQVLGVPAKVQPSDQLQTIAATSLCSYEGAADAKSILSVLIRVGPPSLDPQANLKQYVDGIKMNMGQDYAIDTVEGLNGPALWNPEMKQLTVFKGPSLAILTMSETGAKDPLESAKALGEIALPRI
jgi:hypothetical protein